MSIVTCLNEGSLNTRLTDKDLFKIRLSLSCLSNRVVVSSVMANLYLWTPPTADIPTSSWQFVKSGVPALVMSTGECGERNPRGVFIYLVDPDSGFSSWKEKLTVNSNYIQQQSNFHTLKLSDDTGAMAGIRFSEEEAANLFLKEVENNSQELLSPSSLPELNKLEIASNKERAKKFRKLKKVEISTPCLFSHVTSITSSTPVGELSPKSGERKNSLVNDQEKPTQVRRSFSMKSRKKR